MPITMKLESIHYNNIKNKKEVMTKKDRKSNY